MRKTFKFLKHPLVWITFLGFLLRLYGVENFPVLHDEIMSTLEGVNKTKESFLHFFYIASLENSLGIMPLYFWIERLFTEIFGQNNWGLRIFPLIMGLLSICLAYYIVEKRFNQETAILSSFIVAVFDIFVWVTSKSQFFEVILIPLSFLSFFFLTTENKNKFYWVSLFTSLMLLTYFGKGLFWTLCFFLWYAFVKIFDLLRIKMNWQKLSLTIKKELLQFSTFFWFILAWIISAQIFIFSRGPIYNSVGLGEIDSIWKILYLTTFGYGIQTKQFLVGSPRDAFLVYDNIHVWPVTGLLFIPFLFGLGFLIKEVIQNWKSKNNFLFQKNIYLLIFGLVPFIFIIFRGVISERFHLLYFVPFVIISAYSLSKLSFLWENTKNKILYAFFLLTLGIYGSYISSWKNWYYFVFNWETFYKLGAIIIFLIFLYFAIGFFAKINKKVFIRSFYVVFLFLLIIINFFFGPLIWGKKAAWNPAADNKLAPAIDYYLEGDEESVINFALEKNNPNICNKLLKNENKDWKEKCLNRF